MQWWAALILGALPSPVADWSFVESQERFVIESVGLRSANESLDPKSRECLRLMGEDCWRCRERGSKKLFDRKDVRACFIGQHLGDPEVRWRCRNVLRRLSSCQQCEGRGGQQQSWGIATCGQCRGVGHFWPVDDY